MDLVKLISGGESTGIEVTLPGVRRGGALGSGTRICKRGRCSTIGVGVDAGIGAVVLDVDCCDSAWRVKARFRAR